MNRHILLLAFAALLAVAGCQGNSPAAAPPAKPPPATGPSNPNATAPAAPASEGSITVLPPPGEFGGKSFRFAPEPKAPEAERQSEAPMSLTASDGTGLKLVRLAARAVVEEPLAFTELRLAFQNPEARVIEGHFKITLPQGATVSRFAMKLDGRWQEGEVVEKQAARRAYEDFLHRRQDPALLEQGAGNEFTARVFPIPANGIKELILSYSQELPSVASRYVLPLRGLPELGELDVMVAANGKLAQELKKTSYVPNADFVLDPQHVAGRAGLRNGNLAVARVRPMAVSTPEEFTSAIFLFDTSASRALGFREQVRLLQRLIEGLAAGAGASVPIAVAAFDQGVEEIYVGQAGGFGEDQFKKLRDRRALGASDLQRALRWAEAQAAKTKAGRVVLVTDGVATAGAGEGDELLAAALKLKAAGVERLDAVAVGGIRDDALLRRLVTGGLPHDGVVVDAAEGVELVARRLTESTRSKVEVAVEGASWFWPRKLMGVQAGDEVLVYADLPANAAMKVSLDGKPATVLELPTVERPLLERAWVQARIASLEHKLDVEADGKEQKAALKDEIVALSTRHRVLSRYTALLVLETERDYARFGIDRKALADILTVDAAGRIALEHRKLEEKQPTVAEQAPADVVAPMKNKGKKEDAAEQKPMAARKSLSNFASNETDELMEGMDAPKGGAAKDDEAVLGGAPPAPEPMRMPSAVAAPAPAAPPAEEVDAAPRMEADTAERRVRAMDESRSSGLLRVLGAGGDPRMEEAARAGGDIAAALSEAEGGGVFDGERGRPTKGPDPYTGRFKKVMDALARGDKKAAHDEAYGWREEDPGDVMALVALGEVFEAGGDLERAARAYGSIIDLFSSRADLRRFAGERLERLAKNAGLELAADTYGKAAEQRPDHPASHRLYAFALLKKGEPQKAFEAIVRGAKERYPDGRFRGVDQILREDVGLIGAAWIKAEPGKAQEILNKVKDAGGAVEDQPSLRFVLNWETDANDVDFHIYDAKGFHAYYSHPQLGTGGNLYADVTTGYGPECFTIRLPKSKRAYPYTLQAHYYSRGPMGYGMGKLQIIDHDGKGGLQFEDRAFVVMVDQAFVDMGVVGK